MSKSRLSGPGSEVIQLDDPGADPEQDTSSVTRDDVFEMLSNRRRRYVLHYLQASEETDLSTLAEQVAAWEHGLDVSELSADERKNVYTSLQQFHLPKLAETDIITFDKRSGHVELTDAASKLDIYLEVVDERDIPWSVYYLGFSLLGVTMVGPSLLGFGPLATVPAVGWTVFLLAALVVTSISHFVLSRRMRLGASQTPPEIKNDASDD